MRKTLPTSTKQNVYRTKHLNAKSSIYDENSTYYKKSQKNSTTSNHKSSTTKETYQIKDLGVSSTFQH